MDATANAIAAEQGSTQGPDAIASARAIVWPDHDAGTMARDFLFWRHLRVVRARTLRHVHRLTSGAPAPVRTVYGVEMMSNWSDKTYAYCTYGTYGNYLADLIGAVDVPFAFLDVGANQGLFSLIAGRNPACERIVAIDPVPDTWRRLVGNLQLSGLDDRAKAINAGFSDRAGQATIALKTGHSGLATLGSHLDERGSDDTHLTIDLVTASEVAPHLPDHLPIFVKIDVEGHEAAVIDELLASPLAARIFAIFYEHDDRWSDTDRIARALLAAGFAEHRRYGRGRHYDVLATPIAAAAS